MKSEFYPPRVRDRMKQQRVEASASRFCLRLVRLPVVLWTWLTRERSRWIAYFIYTIIAFIPGLHPVLKKKYICAVLLVTIFTVLMILHINFWRITGCAVNFDLPDVKSISYVLFLVLFLFHLFLLNRALVSMIRERNKGRVDRFSRFVVLCVSIVILNIFYHSLNSVTARNLEVHVIHTSIYEPTFIRGDMLRIRHYPGAVPQPCPGDIVLFDPGSILFPSGHRVRERMLERIIGVSGDRVKIQKDKIIVNGEQLEENLMPITKFAGLNPEANFTVEDGKFLVFFSFRGYGQVRIEENKKIKGKVIAILYPLSRRRSFE